MKIKSLEILDFPPIKNLKIENLGSTIIIAGANGAGKTRLKQAIVNTLSSGVCMNITLEATRPEEEDEKYFNGKFLDVKMGGDNSRLTNYINSRKYGFGKYVGSFVQIDSRRNIETIQYSAVNWLGVDPDDQETPSTFYFNDFTNRWQDFMRYIHQKSAVRDKKIAEEVKANPSKTGSDVLKEQPDPLEKYREAFKILLPGKELQDISPANPGQFTYKDSSGNPLPFNALSSGEQEVVKVVFDVLRKDIRHSIIIVDEPELHLHPTLTFKLVETLKEIGGHTNQFIFLTHSADLISTYYSTGDVYFIDGSQSGSNQAHKLSDLNHTHKQLVQLVGENLGLFAVGKKLIFVEGENSSIDRIAYHSISRKVMPEAKIIPVGSVENILALNAIEEQIRNSIFGIDFYMIRDRDGLSSQQIEDLEKNGKVNCLKRRHIENYFLDPEILFKVAEKFYLTSTNTNLTKDLIESETLRIAKESLNYNLLQNFKEYIAFNHSFKIPNVKSVDAKTIEVVIDEIVTGIKDSVIGFSEPLEESKMKEWLENEKNRLGDLLTSGSWKEQFHGKFIFSKICSDILKNDPTRIRQAYVDIALEEKPAVLKDISDIFLKFST